MRKVFFQTIFAFICFTSISFGQNTADFKSPKTIKIAPKTSFNLSFPEAKDLTSPYFMDASKVFDLDKKNEELFLLKINEISKGLGFWIGQSEALKEISKQFPDLISKCVHARDSFNRNYGPAILQAAYTMESSSKGELSFNKFKNSIFEEMKKFGKANPEKKVLFPWFFGLKMDREVAEGFISTVELRAKLDSNFEELGSLLIFHPSAIGNPLGMTSGDFLRRYDYDSHPKAKGLPGWVRFPAHWERKEGNGPNIVAKFVSPRDDAMFFIQIRSMPEEISEDEDLKPILDDDETLSQFANQGKILSKRIVNIGGQSAIELRIKIVQETPMAKIYQEQLLYLLFYKKWFLGIMGGVSAMNEEDCKAGMKENLQLFQYLATMCGIKRN